MHYGDHDHHHSPGHGGGGADVEAALPVAFGHGRRQLNGSHFTLRSIGVDIGSTTSHFTVSELEMGLVGARFVPLRRSVEFASQVLLTPHAGADLIDVAALRSFLVGEFARAGITPEDIDVGAVILTGTALARSNSRLVADVLADWAGKLVVASAGDVLEATLAARGSGAVELSRREDCVVLHADVGGGTTKFAVCDRGVVVDVAALNVGARVLVLGPDRSVRATSGGWPTIARALGLTAEPVGALAAGAEDRVGAFIADRIVELIGGGRLSDVTRELLLTPPLTAARPAPIVTLSGGVSEYVYGRESGNFADVGRELGAALLERLSSLGTRLTEVGGGIRSTVNGASQFTVQVSSQTIHVDGSAVLPVRNVPVVAPALATESAQLDADAVAEATLTGLTVHELLDRREPVAIAVSWRGSATYDRLCALSAGLATAMAGRWSPENPAIVVVDRDIAGLLGRRLRAVLPDGVPLVAIDGIELQNFDFVDIGEISPSVGVTPVVVKSLTFPEPAR